MPETRNPTTGSRRPRGLDDRDIAILRELQANARISNAELSRRVHLSATPCMERVRRLEREGYIDGYATLLNPSRLDAALLVFVELTLDRTTKDAFATFAEAVQQIPELLECHMVAGGFDYLLKVRARDMDDYRRLLGESLVTIPGVSQTHTYVVMEQVKESVALPIHGE
ncbi:MAG: leucine-responsive transcriptional regulator Lrp [Rhodospirillales bacterium]